MIISVPFLTLAGLCWLIALAGLAIIRAWRRARRKAKFGQLYADRTARPDVQEQRQQAARRQGR